MVKQETIDGAIKYYQDLMLYQYQNQQKATDTIKTLVDSALVDLVPLDVQNAFDIETAEGVQLDILGKYIGLARQVAVELDRPYWRLADYETYTPSSPLVGMTDYEDRAINNDSVWYQYQFAGESFYTLTDGQYRTMLKLKIVLNSSDNTLKSIAQTMFDFFGLGVRVYDAKDMTLSYAIDAEVAPTVVLASDLGLLPHPQGVGISGIFQFSGQLFAFADYAEDNGNTTGFSDYETGFNGYHWLQYEDKIA
jgi:hypothetical protein